MRKKAAEACSICSGSGWLPVEGSRDARPCACQRDLKKSRRIAAARIPKRYIHCTLSTFHDRHNISLAKAKKRIAEFVDLWPGESRGLLLLGACGVGKTHLAVSALQEIIETGKPGKLMFRNFQDLIQEIHASFSSTDAPTKSEILQPLLEVDLLVLDELGSQKPTSFVQEILYYIINSRYNEEKATIFTSNYFDEKRGSTDETLEERIGAGLRSRLHEMTERVLFDPATDDYRKSVAGRKI